MKKVYERPDIYTRLPNPETGRPGGVVTTRVSGLPRGSVMRRPDIIAQALLAPTSRVYEFDFDPYDSYREWTAPICAAAASAPGITRFRTGPRFMPLPQEVEEWLELARRSDPGAGVVRDDGKGMLQLTLCKWAMPARSA